jgi:hypothetical protein
MECKYCKNNLFRVDTAIESRIIRDKELPKDCKLWTCIQWKCKLYNKVIDEIGGIIDV